MKPDTLKDLLAEGHIELGEVRKIAKSIFDGRTTAAGPEGYVITAVEFEDLPDHVQGFIVKAVLEFRVNNILDLDDPEDSGADEYDAVDVDGNPVEPPTVNNEVI